ncbi:MAG: aminotransferase class I/II-fold pyridoxal phosphate-dependent enzyme [Planctomycetes bacterium]|nr:aminotransferase class I/II-fold pyridoxal phosphate-dependent enzyme [Planctomycetota bacterium]
MIEPSARSREIRYAVRDVLAVAAEAKRAGRKLYPLNIGDPLAFDFKTPPAMIEAVERAMRDGRNGYGDSIGLAEALDAVRADAGRRGIRAIRRAFLCSGTSEGIEIALASLANRGDNVLVPSPGYPLYEAVLHKLEIECRHYPLVEERGWSPDVERMAELADARTRAAVVINPNNPTGSVAPRETLASVVGIAAKKGFLVIADEIYDKLVLDGPAQPPLASLSPDVPVLTFNGLSKAYLAPGWRMGWGILSGPEKEVQAYGDAVEKFLRARLSSNHPMMYAVKPALEGDQSHLGRTVETLRRRRDVTQAALTAMPGVSCVPPAAAFYAFPRLAIREEDEEFVRGLIRATGVIVVHGAGFGQAAGTRHFRVVFLPPEEVLKEALGLVRDYIARHAS